MGPPARRRLRLQLQQRRSALRWRSIGRRLAKAISRAQQHASPSAADRRGSRRAAAAARRTSGGNPRAPELSSTRVRWPSSPVSRPVRSAVRSSPTQGHHRHPARSPDGRRSTHAGGAGVLGRRGGSRLGRSRERVRCSTPSCSRARSRCRRPKVPVNDRSRALKLDDGSNEASAELADALAPTEFTECGHDRASSRVPARALAWPTPSLAGSKRCSDRTGSWSSTPADPPRSRWSPMYSCASCESPGAPRRSPPRRARHWRRWPPPQVVPQPDSIVAVSPRMACASAHPARRAIAFVVGDSTFTAAALVAKARPSPERFSPNVLLRPIVQDTLFPTICYVAGPSELAYLGQLRERLRAASASRCRSMYPRATATLVDSATARGSSPKYNVPLRGSAATGRIGTQSAAAVAAAASVEQAMKRRRRRDAAEMAAGHRGDARTRSDARRRGEDDARQDGARAARPPEQDDSSGETPRRNAPPPVHARAGADLSARPSAGTNAGVVCFLNRYGPAWSIGCSKSCHLSSGSIG